MNQGTKTNYLFSIISPTKPHQSLVFFSITWEQLYFLPDFKIVVRNIILCYANVRY